MASAVLASRNETNWSSSSLQHHQQSSSSNFMGKFPSFLNPNPNSSISNFNHPINDFRKQLRQNGVVNPSSVDDTVSFNRRGGGGGRGSFSHFVSFDITGLSKVEIRKLKSQLISELDRVRNLSSRIESGDVSKKRPSPFPPSFKDTKRFGVTNGDIDNHSYQQSPTPEQPRFEASAQLMKMCMTVLKKLMNQKLGYVFNSPVDVVGMGLHDYHLVVKRPMDLGTIKAGMEAAKYDTPEDFAADVRLTFNNALLYNPKGHEVHTLAEQYLALFERWFVPIYQKSQVERQQHLQSLARKNVLKPEIRSVREETVVVEDEGQPVLARSWSRLPSPEPQQLPKVKKPSPRPEPVPVRVPTPVRAPTPPPPRRELSPAMVHKVESGEKERVRGERGRGRRSGGKLPKPKAKDPNKRKMNMDEKHKLGAGLQSLPEEKMVQVIQIIRKRNGHLTQDGDEIELDIEAVDTETLWELDRFVTNYNKMVSKIRRQALMDSQNNNNVGRMSDDTNQVGESERMVEMAKAKRGGGGGDMGEEDVDIGDEMLVNHFPPVEIDKEDDDRQHHGGGGASSSSSSGSSSSSDDSSSSDSDSGSSSGSDSDVDDAQSRDNESKNIHR